MQIFKFGDFEAEIDTADADFMEKFETESEAVAKEQSGIEKSGKQSEVIRKVCACTFAYFDRLFGEGTYKLMFGDTVNARLCDAALFALCDAIKADKEEYNQNVRAQVSAMTGNRKSRRAQKK